MPHAAKRHLDRCPSHPGAVILDMLEDMTVSKAALARHLGISRQHLYDILAEKKPITRGTAARFGAAFGNRALFWLNLQAAYDAWHAERDEAVKSIPLLQRA